MKRTIYFFCFGFLIALTMFLASCGTPSEKRESSIQDDIKLKDSFYSAYDLAFDSFTITKRQTNPDAKTDYIWIQTLASNNDFTYYSEYILTYILYNDGWMLEEYTQQNCYYLATNHESVNQADADEAIDNEGFDSWTFVERADADNIVAFSYVAQKTKNYLSEEFDVTVYYTFAPSAWTLYQVALNRNGASIDINGEWAYNDAQCDIYVNIVDVDMNNMNITLEYDFDNINVGGSYSSETATLSSNGVVTLDLGRYRTNQYYVKFPNQDRSYIWIYVGEGEFPGYPGINVTSYLLKRR